MEILIFQFYLKMFSLSQQGLMDGKYVAYFNAFWFEVIQNAALYLCYVAVLTWALD